MNKITTFLVSLIILMGLNESVYSQKRSPKRGVSYNIPYTGDLAALSPGVSWFYNWGTSPNVVDNVYNNSTNKMDYCPMAWNGTNAAALRTFKSAHPECKYILAFNEPNLTDQANMTPTQAAALWPALKAIATELNLKIISPAMNFGTLANYGDPIVWLDEFFKLIPLSDIDGIAIHTYMNDPSTATVWYVNKFTKYKKPIWMTEFCAWENNAPMTTSAAVGYAYQRDGMVQKIESLELNPLVARYAWFIPRSGTDGAYPYMQLLKNVQGTVPAGTLTELGQIFVNMSSFDSTRYYSMTEKIAAKDYMRSYPVKLEASTDAASTFPIQVGSFDKNFYAEYFINVASADTYPLTLHIANNSGVNPGFKITSKGVDLITQTVTSSGGSSTWVNRIINVKLAAGKQTMRITSTSTSGVKMQWLTFAKASGINEVQEDQLKVFVDGNKTLNVIGDEKVLQSTVFDISGKMLIQDTSGQKINVATLENGVYILLVKLENGSLFSSKFIINK